MAVVALNQHGDTSPLNALFWLSTFVKGANAQLIMSISLNASQCQALLGQESEWSLVSSTGIKGQRLFTSCPMVIQKC